MFFLLSLWSLHSFAFYYFSSSIDQCFFVYFILFFIYTPHAKCPCFPFCSFASSTTSPFPTHSVQHASWWTRGSSLWSHPQAVPLQVLCSLWQMQCTSPIFSSRETGMVLLAPPASSTPAQTERATHWLPVHLFELVMSFSPLSLNCTGRSSSSFMRATMVSWNKSKQLMAKCMLLCVRWSEHSASMELS